MDARTLEEARRELAAEMGVQETEIRISTALSDEAARVVNSGVIVELHIGRWGARKKLTTEDLGIASMADLDAETQQAVEEVLDLGQKYLLPQEVRNKLASLEVSGRKLLDRFAFTTPWGKWVPAGSYRDWAAENDALRREYLGLAADISRNIEDYKAIMRLHYIRQGGLAYKRVNGYKDTADVYVPEYWVQDYADKIVGLIPTGDYILSRFYWNAAPTMVPLPSMFAEDALRRDELLKAGQQARALDDAQFEAEKVAREAVASYWQERKFEYIDQMMRDLASQFRGHIYEAVVTGLESLAGNDGKLVGKAAEGLRNLVEWARSMNAYQDQEMGAAIECLNKELGKAPAARDAADIDNKLRALGVIARKTTVDLKAPGKSARRVGIPDNPIEADVKAARRVLGIEGIPELQIVRAIREV